MQIKIYKLLKFLAANAFLGLAHKPAEEVNDCGPDSLEEIAVAVLVSIVGGGRSFFGVAAFGIAAFGVIAFAVINLGKLFTFGSTANGIGLRSFGILTRKLGFNY